MTQNNTWGGYRPGSGQKPKWNAHDTKAVRIPEKLLDDVLFYARLLDSGLPANELLSCQLPGLLENVQNQVALHELVRKWQHKASRTSNPKWYHAKRLLDELQEVL
jgi:hypothetical protein